MKTIITLLFLAAALSGYSQSNTSGYSQPISVHIASEAEELARGYAAAFPAIKHTPIYMNLYRDGATVTLVSIKSIRAVSGVLVVETDKGLVYVLNPKDIVSITDAPPTKKPQS